MSIKSFHSFESVPECEKTGCVSLWNFPLNRRILLKRSLHTMLVTSLRNTFGSVYGIAKGTHLSRPTIQRFLSYQRSTIRVTLTIFRQVFGSQKDTLLQDAIIWIGSTSGRGIHNPQLPFCFNSRSGARFLAAVYNEGWISDAMYYSNSEQELRSSVKSDAETIFHDLHCVKEWKKTNDQYLSFTSIMRDAVLAIVFLRGKKSEINPRIPTFILNNKNCMKGWIEQTIADEGYVVHDLARYRREIIWRRSFLSSLETYALVEDEHNILSSLGIHHDIREISRYYTNDEKEKIRFHVRLSGKKSLLLLRGFITIPLRRKDSAFSALTSSYILLNPFLPKKRGKNTKKHVIF